jgi:chorismate synthase
MSGNTFGKIFRVTTWGESHGKAVGCVVDGCPSGLDISEADIQRELDRRRPGGELASKRMEEDRVHILSGVFEGKTTGTPISLLVYNKDTISEHYVKIKDTPRPGHADLTYWLKYGHRDWRGGGRASARETVARVAAGAIAKKLLLNFGVNVIGYAVEICGIGWNQSVKISDEKDYLKLYEFSERSPVRVPDFETSSRIIEKIKQLAEEGDSAGGIAEIVVLNPPAGLGEPVFGKLSAVLSMAVMSVPAVKGVEIGAGFGVARMLGSENNDPIILKDGKICLETNNCGGILGGISTGNPIVLRVAIKPTPSISKPQKTIDLKTMEETEIRIHGRHDTCIVPRAIPVLEAMVAITIVDFMLLHGMIPRRLISESY